MTISKNTANFVSDWAMLPKVEETGKEVKKVAEQIFFDNTVAQTIPQKEVKPTHIPENSTFSHYF